MSQCNRQEQEGNESLENRNPLGQMANIRLNIIGVMEPNIEKHPGRMEEVGGREGEGNRQVE